MQSYVLPWLQSTNKHMWFGPTVIRYSTSSEQEEEASEMDSIIFIAIVITHYGSVETCTIQRRQGSHKTGWLLLEAHRQILL